jgi:aspartate aminotransferase
MVKAYPRLWVISDEIYSRLVYDGASNAPSYLKAAEAEGVLDRAMMFDGASKTFCMTGWRLGWASFPLVADVIKKILEAWLDEHAY